MKARTTLTLEEGLVEKAHSLGINVSQTAVRALKKKIARMSGEQLKLIQKRGCPDCKYFRYLNPKSMICIADGPLMEEPCLCDIFHPREITADELVYLRRMSEKEEVPA